MTRSAQSAASLPGADYDVTAKVVEKAIGRDLLWSAVSNGARSGSVGSAT